MEYKANKWRIKTPITLEIHNLSKVKSRGRVLNDKM
jgi:hypothetical protein